ncbi:MAG: hypothetical protein V7723_07435 [Sneathiella sp.]|uniref:hypothetical protein n=1 Tax=Sneathiella sp. TaxID=1964365 RepID=UPI0030022FD6
MRDTIYSGLVASIDSQLVDELLDSYEEAKANYYEGGHRLSAVEGGRFCEAAFRVLEICSTGNFTPLGKSLNTEKLISFLSNLTANSFPDSIRLYIPRALRIVYDIRNNRDAAHLADGIDPNLQDATLVVSVLDWVLSEFVRLYHEISADEATSLIENLVSRKAPIVQEFDGFLKVLNPKLKASEFCLVLLYHKGSEGAKYNDIESWVLPAMQTNLRRTLTRLSLDKAFIHQNKNHYLITNTGIAEVERRKLIR